MSETCRVSWRNKWVFVTSEYVTVISPTFIACFCLKVRHPITRAKYLVSSQYFISVFLSCEAKDFYYRTLYPPPPPTFHYKARLHHIAEVGKYGTVPVFIQGSRRVESGRLHLALGRCMLVLVYTVCFVNTRFSQTLCWKGNLWRTTWRRLVMKQRITVIRHFPPVYEIE
jgi:hypothetical protein